MRTVHIVWLSQNDEYTVEKIFSTEEAADKYVTNNRGRWNWLTTTEHEVED